MASGGSVHRGEGTAAGVGPPATGRGRGGEDLRLELLTSGADREAESWSRGGWGQARTLKAHPWWPHLPDRSYFLHSCGKISVGRQPVGLY